MKLILLIFLTGTVFLISSIYHGLKLCQMVHSSVEYVLIYNSGGELQDSGIEELSGCEHVTAVSRQAGKTVNVKYHMQESSISYIELSEDYLKAVYGIEESSSMKTFYMNETAYNQFWQWIQEVDGSSGSGQEGAIRISYEMSYIKMNNQGPKSAAEGSLSMDYGMAQVIRIENDVPEDEPYVFCKGTNADLKKDADRIRIQFEKQDLDGMNREILQKLGFSVENENVLLAEDYGRRLEIIKIKYGMLIACICIVSAGILVKRTGTEF